jgi:hypothetical protein
VTAKKMRRRQTTDTNNNDHGGIFILTSNVSKYGRRQRTRYGSLLVSVGLLILFAAAYLNLLVPNNHQLLTSSAASDSTGGANIHVGKKQSSPSSLIIHDPPSGKTAAKKNDISPPIPISQTASSRSQPPRIPRRLIFTYKYNLIAPKETDDPPFNHEDPLTANVLHTINTYQKFWDDIDAQDFEVSSSNQKPNDKVIVSFLSDAKCLEVIEEANPRLVQYFNDEVRGEFKADICRVAELYLYGGYYFDIDIGVVEPLNFDVFHLPSMVSAPFLHLEHMRKGQLKMPSKDDIVTFATVFNGQARMFQAFTAAMPRHPVLKRSLDYMVGYYEATLEQMIPQSIIEKMSKNREIANRNKPLGMGMGPYTLAMANYVSSDKEWTEYAMEIMKKHGYSPEHDQTSNVNGVTAKWRYARFLFEISLEKKELKSMGLFADVPLQDEKSKKKSQWCNYVCFESSHVYFYSRVPGSKGCSIL